MITVARRRDRPPPPPRRRSTSRSVRSPIPSSSTPTAVRCSCSTSGAHRVDTAKVPTRWAWTSIKRATPDFVRDPGRPGLAVAGAAVLPARPAPADQPGTLGRAATRSTPTGPDRRPRAGAGADPGPAAARRAVAILARDRPGRGRAAAGAPGLLAAFGIGEAPIGWQGTVSLWRSAGDLVEFAYRHPDHRAGHRPDARRGGGTPRSCSPASRCWTSTGDRRRDRLAEDRGRDAEER